MISKKNRAEISKYPITDIYTLINNIKEYLPKENYELIKKAYDFSLQAHLGQIRRSGEPYISHPLCVAGILAELKLDLVTIATGLLHDTVEDTPISIEEIKNNFGEVIAELVDGVTKISKMKFRNTHEKQSENIRKMIIAMGKDIRVILVKLADRLHNMRTLNHMPYHKQASIAQETLDIYAPLASRLGISTMKIELEDLSFRYLMPEMYYQLVQKVAKKKKEREKYIEEVKKNLCNELDKKAFNCDVQGRPKHFYSIYKKMQIRNIEYEQVYDVLAFRIIIDTITNCYAILGLVHSLWKPIPGRFKDFIAMPKVNNYQSLHTTVVGPQGERIEIQIRTKEMHQVAERGVAAHWKYKENNNFDELTANKFEGLRNLLLWHQNLKNPDEFLDTIKTDLFESEIYVFTPKGDVKEFPSGASIIDFAYSIHTDIGNHCVSARVNGKLVPLRYRLNGGDAIEIITSKYQSPSKDWLKYCITNKAKSKIRSHVKQEQRARALTLGKELLDKTFRKFNLSYLKFLKGEKFEKFLKDNGIHDSDELFIRIGYGKIEPKNLIDKIVPEKNNLSSKEKEEEEESFITKVFKSATSRKKKSGSLIQVDGMNDVLVHFARCCNPIPGDPIVGFMTRGRGITIHRSDCPRTFEMDQLRIVEVEWSKRKGEDDNLERIVRIRIVSLDAPGLLKSISEKIALFSCNINNAQIRTTRDKKAFCIFDLSVRDTQHLTKLINELQKIKGVIGVMRITHW